MLCGLVPGHAGTLLQLIIIIITVPLAYGPSKRTGVFHNFIKPYRSAAEAAVPALPHVHVCGQKPREEGPPAVPGR